MLLTEWNTEDCIAVRSEEAREEGLEKGRKDEKLSIAGNLLAKGFTPELISETTGLSVDEIATLRQGK